MPRIQSNDLTKRRKKNRVACPLLQETPVHLTFTGYHTQVMEQSHGAHRWNATDTRNGYWCACGMKLA